MPRLPQPGADFDDWGQLLNDYLSQAHNSDGTIKANAISESALSPEIQTKLNAVAELQSAADASLAISVTDYGAVGNGVADDTAAIQAAVVAANGRIPVAIPAGTYMINAGTGLQLNIAGTRLILAPSATLKAITNSLASYVILNVTAADCAIVGGIVMGDITTHVGSAGEWGHGIIINGAAHRCLVERVTVKHCWGDGIYIGNGMPTDVQVVQVIADSNRRQGMSVVGANRIRVQGGSYINTGALGAVAPTAGIDIEPNPSSGNNVIEFILEGAVCASNVGPGIQLTRATAQTTRGKVSGCIASANGQAGILSAGSAGSLAVDVVGCSAIYNSGDGVQAACPGLVVNGGRAFANTGHGVSATTQVDLQGCTVSFNAKCGLLFGAGSNNSTVTGMIIRNNGSGAATTWHEVDVASTGLIMSGSVARPATSGNRAIYGINVRSGATGAVFAGCRATVGTSGAISPRADTVQAPAVS